ncbi:hypothetical protein CFC21_012080 [Triticum aestivum]|uniref:threonine--tRNA ligase n=2 Tax=Triticum aestivum TaxID=4565 RepID=A0A9R1IWW3_WHEAT|nr:hypothetical protein CFC21_012080 [Triticum aestivum]
MGAKDKAQARARAPPPAVVPDEAYLEAVTGKRDRLFEQILDRQARQRAQNGGSPIKITLHDGTVKEGKKWMSTPMDIAKEISSGLAASCLIAQVNGGLWDMTRPLEGDCELNLLTFDSKEGRDTLWHSSAHILGEALKRVYGCKLFIGPCTARGEGFYYDAYYDNATLNGSPTLYRCGPLVDLCRGPHIPNTSFVKAFACLKASSSYWRGKADRESLQRVYGISFPHSKLLKEYQCMMEEAAERDHRLLGESQKLFFFDSLSPGSCFFLPHGKKIVNKLKAFLRQKYRDRGYQEVESPTVLKMKLWETSGHSANYKENMFVFEIDGEEFGLKPMYCPGHCIIFKHETRSYRELPLRIADFGVLHRNEASGALSGLTRVRRFQQDDAHIFCRESQRPEKYLGDIETWNKAEQQLAEALDEFGKPWEINEGDGAFYGPKIDIGVFDALKRKFQCATLQLDFALPVRFKLTYAAEEEAKLERPVIIHRAILGSVERMFAILLEHYCGKWPLWLSPRQAIVCSISSDSLEYAKQVHAKIHNAGFDVEIDMTDKKLPKKVYDAQLAQFNYILAVGPKEVESEMVTVRVRDKRELSTMSVDDLISLLRDEVAAYR